MCGQLAKHFGVKSKPARVDMAGEVTWQVTARWPERLGEGQASGLGKDEAAICWLIH